MEKRKIRLIVSKEVTDEQIGQAEKILDAGVDPNWDMSFGSMYIGVTGRHQVYYTLWKHAPRAIMNPMIYLGNLSTDIIEAARKAKQRAGRQPVYFDDYETLKGMQGAQPEMITFGKYRGRLIGEVYAEDPQYIIWLSKNMSPRNQKQMKQYELIKTLTDDYFRALGEKNRAVENKEYFTIGQKFQGVLDVFSIKDDTIYNPEMGYYNSDEPTYKVKAENENFRFIFKLTRSAIMKAGNIKITNHDEFKAILPTIKKLEVAGTAKYNMEIVGRKYTRLSRVKILKIITE